MAVAQQVLLCLCLSLLRLVVHARAAEYVAESGRMKVAAWPSNHVVLHSSVLLSCVYDYSNASDAIGAARMNLMLGGIFCFSGCTRSSNRRCSSLQSADCLVTQDETRRLLNVSYAVANVDAALDGKRVSCSLMTSSVGISLFIKNPPRMLQSAVSSGDVVQGRSLVVNCSFTAPELRSVLWLRGEHSVALLTVHNETLHNSSVSASGVAVQLSQLQSGWLSTFAVDATRANDSGDYRCHVESEYGKAFSAPMPVNVLAPVAAVTLQVAAALANTRFTEGVNTTLLCSVLGGSAPFDVRIYEQYNGSAASLLYFANQSSATEHSNVVTLTRQHNLATFFCDAANSATYVLTGQTVVSQSLVLTVTFAPAIVQPIITGFPELVPLGNNDVPINVSCSFPSASLPPVDLVWFRNDSRLTNGTFLVQSHAEFNGTFVSNILTILPDALQRTNNMATYRCEAFYDSQALSSSEKHAVTIIFPPSRLAMQPQTTAMQRLVGQTLTLQCIAEDSNPPTSIRWIVLDQNNLECNDSRITLRTETRTNDYGGVTTISTSTFEPLALRDNDLKFICSFECDRFSNSKLETKLVVLDVPVVSIVIDKERIEEGDNVTLECQTRGGNPSDPAQFKYMWSFNNEALKQSDRVLKIEQVESRHIGTYKCYVESIAGLANAQRYLDLRYSARCVRQCDPLHSVPVGYDYSLHFAFSSNPLPSDIRWLRVRKNESKLTTHWSPLELTLGCGERCSWNVSFGTRLTEVVLRLLNVSDADNGWYVCVVENELGSTNFTFEITAYVQASVSEVFRAFSVELVLIISCVVGGCVVLTVGVTLAVVCRNRAKTTRRRRITYEGEENDDAENELDLPACSTLRFQDELAKAGFRKASNIFENFVPTYQSVQTCSSASDSALGSTPEPCESDTLLLKLSDEQRPETIPEEVRHDGEGEGECEGEDNLSLYDNVEDRDWVCQPIKNAVLMYQNDTQSVDRRKHDEPVTSVNPLATERRHTRRHVSDLPNPNIRVCPPVSDALILLKR